MAARRQRAHESETLVARWFAANGWPHAEPVGSGRPGSDVTGMPGLCVEVKARREFRPVEWLKQHSLLQMAVTTADDDEAAERPVPMPFVVWRPDGMGPLSVGSWGVMMRLDDFTALLKEAGYGG